MARQPICSRSTLPSTPLSLGAPLRLNTERLVLRRATIDDLGAMHEVLSNKLAMRYWSRPPHDTEDVTRDWLQSMIEAPPDKSNDFVIELDGKVIGKAGCWRLPEIGFIVHPDHWGKGLATEALQAAITSTFSVFPIATIEADVDPRNEPSLRLLMRHGFVQTGYATRTWCLNGEWADSVYLTLRREMWDA